MNFFRISELVMWGPLVELAWNDLLVYEFQGRLAKHCWKECTYHGWCWVLGRCNSRSDCINMNVGTKSCDGRCQNP